MRWAATVIAGLAIAGGAYAIGRASVDSGTDADTARDEGRAAGIEEGRALQQPVAGRKAFRAGYVAGANDVFGGFDGGWSIGTPYRITLERGEDGVTYRIKARSPGN
jgi:hypothetical protein